MARLQARRRASKTFQRVASGVDASQALLLMLSFVVGAVLDWVRHQPYSFTWGWQMEMFVILLAAWASVSLMSRWPRHDNVARTAGLLLLALFCGSIMLHVLLDHP